MGPQDTGVSLDQLPVQAIITGICLSFGGMLLKTPRLAGWVIPYLLVACGAIVYGGWSGDWSARGMILGAYAALASTGLYEMTKKRGGDGRAATGGAAAPPYQGGDSQLTNTTMKKTNQIGALVKCFLILGAVVFLTGCARFQTHQWDVSIDDAGERRVETITRANTFFASKAKLADLETFNSDASQKTSVGSAELITEERLADIVRETVTGVLEAAKIYTSGGASAVVEGVVDGASGGGGSSGITISGEDLDKIRERLLNRDDNAAE